MVGHYLKKAVYIVLYFISPYLKTRRDSEDDFICSVDERIVDMQLWRSKFSAFMSFAQMQYCSKLIIFPLSVFHRMSESIGDPKGELLFIFNTGRCGSTLITKVTITFVISHVF